MSGYSRKYCRDGALAIQEKIMKAKWTFGLKLLIICAFLALPILSRTHAQGNRRTYKLLEGTIKIAEPANWQRRDDGALADSSHLIFVNDQISGILKIEIDHLHHITFEACNKESYQKDFMQKQKLRLQGSGTSVQSGVTFKGVPALFTDQSSGDLRTKEIHFLKNCRYYIVTFTCEKEEFNINWQSARHCIDNMELGY